MSEGGCVSGCVFINVAINVAINLDREIEQAGVSYIVFVVRHAGRCVRDEGAVGFQTLSEYLVMRWRLSLSCLCSAHMRGLWYVSRRQRQRQRSLVGPRLRP